MRRTTLVLLVLGILGLLVQPPLATAATEPAHLVVLVTADPVAAASAAHGFTVRSGNVGDAPVGYPITVYLGPVLDGAVLSAEGPGWTCSTTAPAHCVRQPAGGRTRFGDLRVIVSGNPDVGLVTLTALVYNACCSHGAEQSMAQVPLTAAAPPEPGLGTSIQPVGVATPSGAPFQVRVRDLGRVPIAGPHTTSFGTGAETAGGPGWSCEVVAATDTNRRHTRCTTAATAQPLSELPVLSVLVHPANGSTRAFLSDLEGVHTATHVLQQVDTSAVATTIDPLGTAPVSGSAHFDVRVANLGDQAAAAPVTLSLPVLGGEPGAPVNASGTSWSCTTNVGAPTTLDCTSSVVPAAGQELPVLHVAVPTAAEPGTVVLDTAVVPVAAPGTVGADLVVEATSGGAVLRDSVRRSYDLVVRNAGSLATLNPVRLVLPGYLDLTALTGPGWTCTQRTLFEVACSSTGPVLPGGTLPALTYRAPDDPVPFHVNQLEVRVESDDDIVPANDAGGVRADVVGPTRVPQAYVTAPPFLAPGAVGRFAVHVVNSGFRPTRTPVRVVLDLPEGTQAIGGAGWSCTFGPTVCTYAVALPGRSSAFDLLVDVRAPGTGAPGQVHVGVDTISPEVNPALSTPGSVASATLGGPAGDLTPRLVVPSPVLELEQQPALVRVLNTGTAPHTAGATVVLEASGNLTAYGTGWACGPRSTRVACTHGPVAVPARSALPDLELALNRGASALTATVTSTVDQSPADAVAKQYVPFVYGPTTGVRAVFPSTLPTPTTVSYTPARVDGAPAYVLRLSRPLRGAVAPTQVRLLGPTGRTVPSTLRCTPTCAGGATTLTLFPARPLLVGEAYRVSLAATVRATDDTTPRPSTSAAMRSTSGLRPPTRVLAAPDGATVRPGQRLTLVGRVLGATGAPAAAADVRLLVRGASTPFRQVAATRADAQGYVRLPYAASADYVWYLTAVGPDDAVRAASGPRLVRVR